MRYATFVPPENQTNYEICFLVPKINKAALRTYYVDRHLADLEDRLLVYDLYKEKRTPVSLQRTYLKDLLPELKAHGTKYLVVCDAEYFKTLTKSPSPEKALGYAMPSQGEFEGTSFEGFTVLYAPNPASVFYNPTKFRKDIVHAMHGLKTHRDGTYIEPGKGIIKQGYYAKTVPEIDEWLNTLLEMNCDLYCDIETFSLKHYDAGIGTIGFSWSKDKGVAFPVDLDYDGFDMPQAYRDEVRQRLVQFFQAFAQQGKKMRWHNISYDVTVLIYQLFMKDLLDTEGLLEGLDVFLTHKKWDCTLLLTYLATNSCAGNKLGLKEQSQEFSGKYAIDVQDIRSVPLDNLLTYNLIDCLSTAYVYEKHYPTVVKDQQLELYEGLFKDSIVDIVQMQLTGLPVDMDRVVSVNDELNQKLNDLVDSMRNMQLIKDFEQHLRVKWRDKMHAKWKKKRIELKDVPINKETTFNPNSGPQLQNLLYDPKTLGLPVLEKTDTGLPATGRDVLELLRNHTLDKETLQLLDSLIEYSTIVKLTSAFLPHFLAAPRGPDGWHYLFGSFKLGGTVSGRMSSSGPNLQNLPAANKGGLMAFYGKKLKSCVKAPPGWLFVGLDFNSLEDMISALITKDPNKIKVYTDGYDGHSLRALSYFGDQMPDIDPTSVESVNSISNKYPHLRQASKTPTFLLTYGGTSYGIVHQLNWSMEDAEKIETRYHELYKVSDDWVADKIQKATDTGYVEVAFGLRVRTPLLKQVILGTKQTPKEAKSEARTAGNALGQSWGLLTNRSSSEFMKGVRKSQYRENIRPSAHIHDAQYYLIRDNMEMLIYTNQFLVQACQWQEHPAIKHDKVHIGGSLSVYYPTWAEDMPIPNNATVDEIDVLAFEHYQKVCKKEDSSE